MARRGMWCRGSGDFGSMQVTVFMADSASLGSLVGAFDFRTEFGGNHQVFANCPEVNSRCSLWVGPGRQALASLMLVIQLRGFPVQDSPLSS